MKGKFTFSFFLVVALKGLAQVHVDSLKTRQLKEVVITDKRVYNVEYFPASQVTMLCN